MNHIHWKDVHMITIYSILFEKKRPVVSQNNCVLKIYKKGLPLGNDSVCLVFIFFLLYVCVFH